MIKSRTMRWEGHTERRGEECIQAFVGKSEGMRPLGKPRRRWEDIIKMDMRYTRWGVDWIHPGQDRYQWRAAANTVINRRVI
jgi:hypothetical protein